MKRLLFALFLASTAVAEPPNVLLICVDDLRPELKSFGVDYIHSPNIDKLAAEGRAFTKHYVQAPTCGASRYTLLTGRYGPASNAALFQSAKNEELRKTSMPAWFRTHGYTTVSVGKVSHHPGGRGGSNWDDDGQPEMPGDWTRHLQPTGDWEHPRGIMHGLANGEIRKNAKEMDLLQAFDGADDSYPDGLTYNEAQKQLGILAKDGKPFFLAVGFLRPHLPFGAPAKYVRKYDDVVLPRIQHPAKPTGKTTWHGSGEFMKYNRGKRNPNEDAEFAEMVRKHYAGCVTYADELVGQILADLEKHGLAENTVVALWGDHGWHLGEHAIWGKHSLFEESLRSPLIVRAPQVAQPGTASSSMVETIDVFPTLCDLCELPKPDGINGASLLPILKDPKASGHPAIAYKNGQATIRTDRFRLIRHKKGETEFVELYDHESPAGETKNVAEEQPEMAASLIEKLDARLN
ncbi:MAG: iduronate 2-sulfatase [Verrucomicrobiales bacterium]|jgi:iduronate 2-sulfatase